MEEQPTQNNMPASQPTTPPEPAPTNSQPAGLKRHVTTRVKLVAIVGGGLLALFLLAATWWYLNRPFSAPAPESLTIKVTSDGFNPAILTINKDTQVTWHVQDQESHRIASNPYPENSDFPSLDSKTNIGPGGSYAFTFSKPGTYRYHDNLNPTINGTIVVQ
jgi:plastocyanin